MRRSSVSFIGRSGSNKRVGLSRTHLECTCTCELLSFDLHCIASGLQQLFHAECMSFPSGRKQNCFAILILFVNLGSCSNQLIQTFHMRHPFKQLNCPWPSMLTSAPAPSNSFTQSMCSFQTKRNRAVWLFISCWLTRAPAAVSSIKHSSASAVQHSSKRSHNTYFQRPH